MFGFEGKIHVFLWKVFRVVVGRDWVGRVKGMGVGWGWDGERGVEGID